MKKPLTIALVVFASLLFAQASDQPTAITYHAHGENIVDSYAWLDNDSPARQVLILAENIASTHHLDQHLQNTLKQEIRQRSTLSDNEEIWQDGQIFLKKSGRVFPKIFVKINDKWQLLQDTKVQKNHLDTSTYILGSVKANPAGTLFAVGYDTVGQESYFIDIIDKNGKIIDSISGSNGNFVWADKKHLLYINDGLTQVKQHTLGTHQNQDKLIYQESMHGFYLQLDKTSSNDFISLTRGNLTTSQVWLAHTNKPLTQNSFFAFTPNQTNTEYYLDHHRDKVVLKTNHSGNMGLYILDKTAQTYWQTNKRLPIPVLSIKNDDELTSFSMVDDYVIAKVRQGGTHQIYYIHLQSQNKYRVNFDEEAYMVWINASGFDQHTAPSKNLLRLGYTSPTTPKTVRYYDMNNHRFIDNHNSTQNYDTKKIWVMGKDGTKLPVTLIHKKGFVPHQNNPLLIYGYGAYGFSLDPVYGSGYLSLVDRGFVYAFAHVRGGGELGQAWHSEGKQQQKHNSFYDFVAITQDLQAKGYGTAKNTFAMGESAGGILIANACITHPHLYQGCVLQVPVLDILKPFYKNTLKLGDVAEFDEWGNPTIKSDYDYIKSYNPYNLIYPNTYPNILIIANQHDNRVDFSDSLKFIAKIRANHKPTRPAKHLIYIGEGGHSGTGEGRTKNNAMAFAFVLRLIKDPTK